MIRKICLLLLGVISIAACSTNTIIDEMNKSNQVLENRVKDNTDRIESLETLCSQMNSNISALKVLIDALQGQDWVKNVTPVTDGAGNVIGYTLEFSKSGTVVIYNGKDGRNGKDGVDGEDGKDGENGKDGKDGENGKDGKDGVDGDNGKDGKDGEDGKDGKDGYTPRLEIRKDADGYYYWTVDGNWMLTSDGDKILASGRDGVTPQLRIQDGFWEVSYDGGVKWDRLGQATGNDGTSFFDDVKVSDDNLSLTLSDGTTLVFPKYQRPEITFSIGEDGTGAASGIEVVIKYILKSKSSNTSITATSDGNYSVKVVRDDDSSGKLIVTPPAQYTDGYVNVFVTDTYGYSLLKVINFHENKIMFPEGLEYSISQEGGVLNIPISMNFDTNIKLDSDWLAIAPNTRAAMRDSMIVVSASRNETFGSRKAVINVYSKTNDYQPYAEIVVNQSSASFSISQTKFAMPYLSSTVKADVFSTLGLKVNVNSGAGWLTVDSEKTGENYVLTMSASKNDTGLKRNGTVTLFSDGNERLGSIQIIQMAEKSDSPEDMVFTVRANVPNEYTSELPLDGEIDCYVDWGDGSVDYYDSKPVKHKYPSEYPASYVVRISGKVTGLNTENISMASVIEVNQWGKTGLKYLRHAFCNNPAIVKVSGCNDDEFINVVDASDMFSNCYNLAEIEGPLFSGCANLNSLSRAFGDCRSLKGIPENLLFGCGKLENVNGMFQGCISLESIPSGLFRDCVKLRYVSTTFNGCRSLSTIPDGLFKYSPDIVEVNSSFSECSSLVSVPVDIFDNNRKINSMSYLFARCGSVQGESPYTLIGGKKIHLYERNQYTDYFSYIGNFQCAFEYTTFTDFDEIPIGYR